MNSLFKRKRKYQDIDPDEIFIDSHNFPQFDRHQLEGRIEKPISHRVFTYTAFVFFLVAGIFTSRLWDLQISSGTVYAAKAETNRLDSTTIFANRGLIVDRNGVPLAWNDLNPATTSDFALRDYATSSGLSALVGYVKYPMKDSLGHYFRQSYEPAGGIEKVFDSELSGTNGRQLTETDAAGKVTSQSVVAPPSDGATLTLSVDKNLSKAFYDAMETYSAKAGYQGGSGVIMDVNTGEIVALSNFPEFDANVMSSASDSALIHSWLSNSENPFLDRAVAGLYTPGSIMKPYVAIGALSEHTIDPTKIIVSTGSISIPNPYDPSNPSVFKDWKALGPVDMRKALAMSSDVYFYEVGGGYTVGGANVTGLGIMNIEKYLRLFGFGTPTGIELSGEQGGTIPDPTWKAANFDGDPWRLGDTYHTSIGQYGVQITPLQAVRAVGAIANGGNLLDPTILKSSDKALYTPTGIDPADLQIVKDGMRMAVTEGTAQALNVPYVSISAKTGTAQVGISKSHVNSWVIGYWPSDAPKYAFALVMEAGPINNEIGASWVMRQVIDSVEQSSPEYFHN